MWSVTLPPAALRLLIEPGDKVVTSLGGYPTFNFHVAGLGGELVTVPYAGDHEDGLALARLLRSVCGGIGGAGVQAPARICTHTTGTRVHAVSELNGIRAAFSEAGGVPALLPLKPLTGHTLGASGLLDVALLAGALREGKVPGCAPHLSAPNGLMLASQAWNPGVGERILKIASGMGGHNAAVLLSHVRAEQI